MSSFSEQTRFSLEDGILCALREGQESPARALSDVRTCIQRILEHQTLFVLVINRTTGILNFTDFMALAEEWRDFTLKSHLKIAFLDEKPSGPSDIAILESICSIKGFDIRFFKDETLARKYLQEQIIKNSQH